MRIVLEQMIPLRPRYSKFQKVAWLSDPRTRFQDIGWNVRDYIRHLVLKAWHERKEERAK